MNDKQSVDAADVTPMTSVAPQIASPVVVATPIILTEGIKSPPPIPKLLLRRESLAGTEWVKNPGAGLPPVETTSSRRTVTENVVSNMFNVIRATFKPVTAEAATANLVQVNGKSPEVPVVPVISDAQIIPAVMVKESHSSSASRGRGIERKQNQINHS